MNTGEKLYTQHENHVEWINKLKFYSDDIIIMKERLAEIASKNNQKDVMANVEHFQNQFIIQKNNIDETMHTIKLDESALEREVNKNPTAVDHRVMPSHAEEKTTMDSFEKNFNELRAEFKTFAAKWM